MGLGHIRVDCTRLVARFASHFELHRPFSLPFSPTTSFAPPPFFLFLFLFLSSRLFLSLSASFPRSWLSLSFAIRQSSCQIKFLGERSPRTRGVHVTAETIRRWMLRNFRIGKTREMYFFPSPPPPPPLCYYFLFFSWYIFYSRGRCLLRLRDFLRSSWKINACLLDMRFFIYPWNLPHEKLRRIRHRIFRSPTQTVQVKSTRNILGGGLLLE